MATFHRESEMPCSADDLYRWHARRGAFLRLAPPWQVLEPVEAHGGIEDGARRIFRIHNGPVALTWEALHKDHIKGEQFVDEQVRGPFSTWRHLHRFEPVGEQQSKLVDHVDYKLPMGALGKAFGAKKTEKMLAQMFAFRHQRTGDDLRRHSSYDTTLRVAITGASGLIGSALTAFLRTAGHEVIELVRDHDDVGEHKIYWSPKGGQIDKTGLENLDAVVHLAGENVAGRWTDKKRARIVDSRVQGTELLSRTLTELDEPPGVFLSASGIGYYGDTGSDIVDEEGAAGTQFLSTVCQRWERATEPAAAAGIRTVLLRLGVVLTPQGGALEQMLRAVRLGLASRLGAGDQFISWIDIDDAIAAIEFLLGADDIAGPVNITAPEAVQNAALLDTIADVLSRPNFVAVPAAAMKLAMGSQFIDETALASQRARPTRLEEAGFEFFYADLEQSLSMKLGGLS